jgi:hypothetical protein
MSTATELVSEDLTDTILPCQYNDLIRKGLSSNEGEYLLLRAVLEDAIRIYLTNRPRSNPLQTRRFEAIRAWFEPAQAQPRGLFDFRSVCDFLGVDPNRLVKALKSINARKLSLRRCGPLRGIGPRGLAVKRNASFTARRKA